MKKKTCFVIAPIGDSGTDIRRRSDKVLKHVIQPAVELCGYETVRADHISEPGIITSQIIQHIMDDPMVVADLTGSNANVFYELAIRHVVRKPYVQVIEKGERIPFDVAAVRTIEVDHTDLDSVDEAKKMIVAQIQTMESGPGSIPSPVSVSIDLEKLKSSGNPEQLQLAQALSEIAELRQIFSSVDKRLANPSNIIPADYLWTMMERFLEMRMERDLNDLEHVMHSQNRLLESLTSTVGKTVSPDQLENMKALANEMERNLRRSRARRGIVLGRRAKDVTL